MHPLLFLSKPCPVRLPRNTCLTIGRGVQGGSSLDCIRIIGKGEILLTILSSLSQEETRRKREGGRYSGVSIFSGKIKCGECGGSFGAKVWHSTDKYRRVICRFDEVTEAIAQRSAKGERLRREASPFRERGSSGRLRRKGSLWRSSTSGCGARWWIM